MYIYKYLFRSRYCTNVQLYSKIIKNTFIYIYICMYIYIYIYIDIDI